MAVPYTENGGFAATTRYLFMPTVTIDGGQTQICVFDPTDFDDPTDNSYYFFRQEDVTAGRQPTVRRVIITYRDLGPASITLTLYATTDSATSVTASTTVSIGNTVPTGILMTKIVELQVTGFRPQLSISRAAGGGPVSIAAVTLIGEIEEVTL